MVPGGEAKVVQDCCHPGELSTHEGHPCKVPAICSGSSLLPAAPGVPEARWDTLRLCASREHCPQLGEMW